MIAEFARVGLLALTIPKQYGGLELSHTGYARVFERISHGRSFAGCPGWRSLRLGFESDRALRR